MKNSKFIYLIALILIVIAGLLNDPSETQQSSVLSATSTTSSPFVVTQTPSTTQSWYELYFTEPGRYQADQITPLEQALLNHVDAARTSIDVAYFEFDLEPLAEALIAAQRRGVKVRLVYDDEHSDHDPQTKEMVSAGISAIPDLRSAYMHNKFMIFDNDCVWTGSFNFTQNATYKNNENAIYFCQKELTQNYSQEFIELFVSQFGPNSPSDTPHPQVSFSNVMVENYFAPEDKVMDKVVAAVNSAQTSIHFMAFSFTDDTLGQTMLFRHLNKVDVQGIFETRGANSSSSQCPVLQDAGISVYLDGNPATFHHKIIIIDTQTVIFGSFNFSGNANRSNDENLLIVHDPTLAQKFELEYQRRLSEAKISKDLCKSD